MVFIYLLFNAGRGAKQRGRGMRGMLQDYRERGGFADRTVIVAAPAIVGVSFTLRRLFSASRDVSTFSLVSWFRTVWFWTRTADRSRRRLISIPFYSHTRSPDRYKSSFNSVDTRVHAPPRA